MRRARANITRLRAARGGNAPVISTPLAVAGRALRELPVALVRTAKLL